jgi:hypothetical protein
MIAKDELIKKLKMLVQGLDDQRILQTALASYQDESVYKPEYRKLEAKEDHQYRVNEMLRKEIASLEAEIEQEEKTASDEFCDFCGKQMQPQNKQQIKYLCMNPECDNYIKLLNK